MGDKWDAKPECCGGDPSVGFVVFLAEPVSSLHAPCLEIGLNVGKHGTRPYGLNGGAFLDQLAPEGRLVVPLSLRGAERSVAFDRADGHLASASVGDCGFMRLRGTFAGPDTSTPLGAEVFLQTDDNRPVDTDRLRAALAAPGSDLTSDISISTAEAFGGFRLWLALYDEPDTADLAAFDAAANQATIPALTTLPGWDQAGRPATHNLHIDAYPAQAVIDTAAAIIDRRTPDWP